MCVVVYTFSLRFVHTKDNIRVVTVALCVVSIASSSSGDATPCVIMMTIMDSAASRCSGSLD